MAQRVFFLNTLKPGVEPADYEAWVRAVDYPIARAQPAILSYVVTRVEDHLAGDGALPCQYLEVLEITDVEEYRAVGEASADFRRLMSEFGEYVGSTVAVFGEVIDS